jgi:predicted enzyme related to lactoylglutathione lyase
MVPSDPPDVPAPVAPLWARAGLRYLTVWVDDLDALVDAWSGSGGEVTMPPATLRPGVRSALLADPDGNVVEAMEESAAP